MAILTGFTRPPDPVNGEQLSAQVTTATGITLDVQVDGAQAIASGAISEANRAAIQSAITAYVWVPPYVGAPLALTKAVVGLGNVDNVADTNKPVSTPQATALTAKADASALLTKANVTDVTTAVGSYHTILEASGSHSATKVAGVYALGFGDPTAVSGTGTLYPLQIVGLLNADQSTVSGLPPRLRVRGVVTTNATAPTGNFTLGLFPVTKGGGVAGLSIYTLGAVIAASQPTTITNPSINTINGVIGADFGFPSDGVYCLGVTTTATVAVASHVHVVARLQVRNA